MPDIKPLREDLNARRLHLVVAALDEGNGDSRVVPGVILANGVAQAMELHQRFVEGRLNAVGMITNITAEPLPDELVLSAAAAIRASSLHLS